MAGLAKTPQSRGGLLKLRLGLCLTCHRAVGPGDFRLDDSILMEGTHTRPTKRRILPVKQGPCGGLVLLEHPTTTLMYGLILGIGMSMLLMAVLAIRLPSSTDGLVQVLVIGLGQAIGLLYGLLVVCGRNTWALITLFRDADRRARARANKR
jgi:hypothetical protein